MANWSLSDIERLKSRSAVVTGTGGLGFESALALARGGLDVVIAGRNAASGADAVAAIQALAPSAAVRFELLDLAQLDSIKDFARRLAEQRQSLDILINNAAIMAPPERRTTKDGLELQFGTNHIGHFALTRYLLPLLMKGQAARVVSLSSLAARGGKINFDDINAKKAYKPMPVYSQSKLAQLMFALELQRRSDAQNWGLTSIPVHPGICSTNLIPNGPGRWSGLGFMRTFLGFMFQPAAQGALPALYAATSSDARGGHYYGPDRMGETKGWPAPAQVPPQAEDRFSAERLWKISEELISERYE